MAYWGPSKIDSRSLSLGSPVKEESPNMEGDTAPRNGAWDMAATLER